MASAVIVVDHILDVHGEASHASAHSAEVRVDLVRVPSGQVREGRVVAGIRSVELVTIEEHREQRNAGLDVVLVVVSVLHEIERV